MDKQLDQKPQTHLALNFYNKLQRLYKLSKEDIWEIFQIISFCLINQCNNIQQKLHGFNDGRRFGLLSYACSYIRIINAPLCPEVSYFIYEEFLNINYIGPETETQVSLNSIEIRKQSLLQHMNVVIEWKKPINSILLYHIRNIIFLANQLRYIKIYKRWPWIQTIFYLQQFIKICTVYNPINEYLAFFISHKKIVNIFKLWKSTLALNNKKDIINLLLTEHSIAKLLNDYEIIRNIYSLNKIITYLDYFNHINYIEERNDNDIYNRELLWFLKLRILQVLGEQLKDTNISPDSKKKIFTSNFILFEYIKRFIELRNDISHEVIIYPQWDKYWNNIDLKYFQDFVSIDWKSYISLVSIDIKSYTKCLRWLFNWIPNRQFLKIGKISIQEVEFQNQVVYNDYCKTLKYALYNGDQLALELKLLIALNYLDKRQHGDKKEKGHDKYYMAIYPILTGMSLRNHLAHGDPIVATLDIDEQVAVRATAKLIIMKWDLFERGELDIRKETEKLIDSLREPIMNYLEILEDIEEFMNLIMTGKFQCIKVKISLLDNEWMHWRTHKKQTALHLACYNNDVEVLKFLIETGPKLIDYKDIYGNTILHLASMTNNVKAVQFILNCEVCNILTSQNLITNENKQTPFHLASKAGNDKIIKLLLSKEIHKYVRNKDIFNFCPMMYSIIEKHIAVVKLLAKHCTESIKECFFFAYKIEAIDIVEYLIQMGFEIKEVQLMVYTTQRKNIQMFEMLTYNGVDIPEMWDYQQNSNKLFNIISNGNIQSLQEYLNQNPKHVGIYNPTKGMNCMYYAVERGNIDMIKLIYEKIPHLLFLRSGNYWTPIERIIELKNNSLLKYILDMIIINYQERPHFVHFMFPKHAAILPDEEQANIILHFAIQVIDTSLDECFYESGLLLIQRIIYMFHCAYKTLSNIRVKGFSRYIHNEYITQIWLDVVLDISATLNDSIPFHVLDLIRNDSKIEHQLIDAMIEKYKSMTKPQIQLIILFIDNKILIKSIISKLSAHSFQPDALELALQDIKHILDQSEPILKQELLDIITKEYIQGMNNYSKLQDLIVYYYTNHEKLMDHFLKALDNFTETEVIQYNSLLFISENIKKHNYQSNKVLTVFIIAVHNIHAFWMCENIMRVCIKLVFHIMEIKPLENTCEINIFQSLLNIPTFLAYIKYCYKTYTFDDIMFKYLVKIMDIQHNFMDIKSFVELLFKQRKFYNRKLIPTIITCLSSIMESNTFTYVLISCYILKYKKQFYGNNSNCKHLRKEVIKTILKQTGKELLYLRTYLESIRHIDDYETGVIATWLFNEMDSKIGDNEFVIDAWLLVIHLIQIYSCSGRHINVPFNSGYIGKLGYVISVHMDSNVCILQALKVIDEYPTSRNQINLEILLASWSYGKKRGYKFIQTVAAITCSLVMENKFSNEIERIICSMILNIILNCRSNYLSEDFYNIVNKLYKLTGSYRTPLQVQISHPLDIHGLWIMDNGTTITTLTNRGVPIRRFLSK